MRKGKLRKGKAQFPCGSCRQECDSECLLCEVCNTWLHSACEGIPKEDFKKWSTINGEYICTKCRKDDDHFDYLRGITRLERAAKSGMHDLKEAVSREILLSGNTMIQDHGPLYDGHRMRTDTVARSIMEKYTQENGTPLVTSADGDCLFNAVSILLRGNETMSVELRYKTALVLVEEDTSIQTHKDKASIIDLSPTYDNATLECAKISSFSCAWTIMALAKVVDRPVRVIFPPVNGEKDLSYRTLNTTFNPDAAHAPLTIMWTSISKPTAAVIKRKRTWTPNHFVAVCGTTNPIATAVADSSPVTCNQHTPASAGEHTVVNVSSSERCAQHIVVDLSSTNATELNSEHCATGKGLSTSSAQHLAPSTSEHNVANSQNTMSPKKSLHVKFAVQTDSNRQNIKTPCDIGKGLSISNAQHLAPSTDVASVADFAKPITSTPIITPENEWQVPKKRRTSGDIICNAKLNLCNRFDSLTDEISYMDLDDEHIAVITPLTPLTPLTPQTRTNKRKRSMSPIDNENDISTESTELSENDDTNDSRSGRVPTIGPCRGKLLHDKFLSTQTLLGMFGTDEGTLPSVPPGIKEGTYFFVNNEDNNNRERSGLKREHWDDCGAWQKGAAPAQHYLPVDGKLVFVTKREGRFCIEKTGRKFQFLDPQPNVSDLVVVNRCYNKLRADSTYKRRISWMGNVPKGYEHLSTSISIWEYSGEFPGRLCHGRVKTVGDKQPYIRAKTELKTKAKNMVKHRSAKNVHDELNQETEIHDLPRNLKQIQNMKYNENKKARKVRNDKPASNLADHLINIENEVYMNDNKFIQCVNHLPSGPSVIIYTDEQIQDIKRFACKDDGAIIGIDKTYNLGQLHLTTTVFKNLSVVRLDTGVHPIFLGPSFLHRKSDFQTFNVFFAHIASHLTDSEIEKMIIGSDDETALRKSINRSFPGSTQLVCTRHLKNNVKDYLSKKIGVNEIKRKEIVKSLFGENGLADADDSIIFQERLVKVTDKVTDIANEFKPYLESRIIPMIKDHVNLPKRLKQLTSDWTNNNAESLNNILKVGTNHKIEDMTSLIDIIRTIVGSMYKDVEKAIAGAGNYKLAKPYEHYHMGVDAWCQKSPSQRAGILNRFYRDKGRYPRCVTSTNGLLTVPNTPGGGKKPHQRRRMAAERATPRK